MLFTHLLTQPHPNLPEHRTWDSQVRTSASNRVSPALGAGTPEENPLGPVPGHLARLGLLMGTLCYKVRVMGTTVALQYFRRTWAAIFLLCCLTAAVVVGAGFALAGFTQVHKPVEGSLLVTSPGDVNLDLKVDGQDLRIVAGHLGDPVPAGGAREAFAFGDVNLDGKVNVRDLAVVGSEFEGRG